MLSVICGDSSSSKLFQLSNVKNVFSCLRGKTSQTLLMKKYFGPSNVLSFIYLSLTTSSSKCNPEMWRAGCWSMTTPSAVSFPLKCPDYQHSTGLGIHKKSALFTLGKNGGVTGSILSVDLWLKMPQFITDWFWLVKKRRIKEVWTIKDAFIWFKFLFLICFLKKTLEKKISIFKPQVSHLKMIKSV